MNAEDLEITLGAYVCECRRAFGKPMDEMLARGIELGFPAEVIAYAISRVALRCAAVAVVGGSLPEITLVGRLEDEIKRLRETRAARGRPLS